VAAIRIQRSEFRTKYAALSAVEYFTWGVALGWNISALQAE